MGEPHLRLKRDAPAGSSFDTVQPNPEFTEMLVGMGFPLELAQAGLMAVKNHSVDKAMDWIEEHRFDPEFQSQPTKVYVTSPSLATRHHSESISVAAPAPQPVAAPVHAPEPTVFTPMSRLAQTAEERRKHEEKERLAELAKMQREKAAAEAHKARVKAQFEEDRKARSKAAAAAAAPTPAPAVAAAPATATPAAKPAARAAPTEALLQIRLPSGDTLRHTFPATATIADVHTFVAERIRTGNFNIIVPTPPRREFNLMEHAQLKLSQTGSAELCPRANVNILLTAERGQVLSSATAPAAAAPVVEGDAAAEELSYEQMLELEEKMGKVAAGLPPALVATFPVVAYRPPATADEKATKCFVCQEDFQANERVRLLPCLHTFHQKCIDRWFEDHKTCPADNLRLDAAPS